MPGPTPLRDDLTVVLELDDRTEVVNRELTRIGTSSQCDLQIASGPPLHSVLRVDAGVLWIEADADTADLMVNWRSCRRLALRDGDVISANGHEMTVRVRPRIHADEASVAVSTLSQLSAEELCDHILTEQAQVNAFEAGQLRGWQRLMEAVQEVVLDDSDLTPDEKAPAVDECESLLNQIRELTDLMDARTRELDRCEEQLTAASTVLQDVQDRVSGQIETLLNQIGEAEHPGELRASA